MIFNTDFGMYTEQGNSLVARISTAAMKLAQLDGGKNAWAFASRELKKLSCAEGFEEAADTLVSQNVFDELSSASPTPMQFS